MAERSHPRKCLRPGRVITRVIRCLFLATVLNVTVAWACALRSDLVGWQDEPISQWPVPVPEGWPAPNRDALREYGFGVQRLCIAAWAEPTGAYWTAGMLRAPPGVEFGYSVDTFRAGWPLHALQGEVWWTTSPVPPISAVCLRKAWLADFETSPFPDRLNVLPLRPIWPGFAINTLLYAVAVWLLMFGPGVARRIIRRRRGRCPKCGYDLRGGAHEHCPECGAVV